MEEIMQVITEMLLDSINEAPELEEEIDELTDEMDNYNTRFF